MHVIARSNFIYIIIYTNLFYLFYSYHVRCWFSNAGNAENV